MYYYGTLLRIQISTATEMLKKKKRIASQDEASKRRKISRTNWHKYRVWPQFLEVANDTHVPLTQDASKCILYKPHDPWQKSVCFQMFQLKQQKAE